MTRCSSLTRQAFVNGYEVVRQSPAGRIVTYRIEQLPNGDVRRTATTSGYPPATSIAHADGTTTLVDSTGTTTTSTSAPDPRWGMLAAYTSAITRRLPSGTTTSVTRSRSASLADPQDPLALAAYSETTSVGSIGSTVEYDPVARTYTTTTAEGRGSTRTVDAQGRTVAIASPGFAPLAITYDAHGRVVTETAGTGAAARTATLTWNAANDLVAEHDPLDRGVAMTYDAAGRLLTVTDPAGNTTSVGYDRAGWMTSLAEPGGGTQAVGLDVRGLPVSYTPPTGAAATFSNNGDGRVTGVSFAGGDATSIAYDGPSA